MQQLLMCGARLSRRGFTMVELLVAMVLLGLVSAALYRVLVNNQRLYMAQTQRIDLSQNIRAAANILPAEFRQLDASDGDIIAMGPDSVAIKAPRWLTFVCVAPLLNGTPTGRQMTVRGMAPGDPMFFGSRAAAVGSDSMYVYLDGDQTQRLDDYYVPSKLTGITATGPALCPAVGPSPAQPGTVVTWDGNFFGGNDVANAIPVGSPVWGFERVTYRLFRQPGDTSWYIGYRPHQPAGTTMQPIIGPVLANGLSFTYYDSTGALTGIKSKVARIDITVRARSNIAVRSGGTAPARTIVDSIVTSVALRNNRRW